MNLIVQVVEIKGNCPAYKEGDSFILKEGWLLEADKPLCMHSLAALLPHYNALRISEPGQWGLAGKGQPKKAYVQCLDPYEHTGGGTAVFEITKEL